MMALRAERDQSEYQLDQAKRDLTQAEKTIAQTQAKIAKFNEREGWAEPDS